MQKHKPYDFRQIKCSIYSIIPFTHIYTQFDIKTEECHTQENEIEMNEPYFEEIVEEVIDEMDLK